MFLGVQISHPTVFWYLPTGSRRLTFILSVHCDLQLRPRIWLLTSLLSEISPVLALVPPSLLCRRYGYFSLDIFKVRFCYFPGYGRILSVLLSEVRGDRRLNLPKSPWPPSGGVEGGWHGVGGQAAVYDVHQMFPFLACPCSVHRAASHNRWGVVERRLPAKTQGRTVDSFFFMNWHDALKCV